jgi:hypothetical protein
MADYSFDDLVDAAYTALSEGTEAGLAEGEGGDTKAPPHASA